MEAATANAGVADGTDRKTNPRAWWVAPLEPYAGANLRSSLVCLATSVFAYLGLWVAMYYLRADGLTAVWLVLLIPASGFLLRTYIVFHDCTHGSFMRTKRANTWVGVAVGLIVFSPFHSWRQEHAGHHATAGDIDRRGVGDVQTLTVSEYKARTRGARLRYRLMRSPWIMFTLGPIWSLAIGPRIVPKNKRKRIRNSHRNTNLALLVLVAGAIWLVGWAAFVEIQFPMILMAGAAGVWLFYVQHQFEGAYWKHSDDWSYLDAALQGSSYLKLGKVLAFFTGYIGLHHVHHLNPRIPNYNLQRAHDENEFLHRAPTLSLWDGFRTVRFKLIDDDTGELLTFAQARRAMAAHEQPAALAA
ncbi:MAG: fatty acid desaturase [Solirubrobacteraceae bacterium]|jgi:omega-6 fatty acid desaturase (delta-12 desaturase)